MFPPPRSVRTHNLVASALRPWQHPCQPCINMILFSDRADTPPAGWFWMVTDLSSTVVLKEGCAYRLTLKLKGDYRKHLSVRDNNPMYFDNLFDVRIVNIR
ncbi:hypothetical protein KJ975_11385 [Myxococcota bacterium]|nr:hypothetical protein [Myxococcota bacterium]